MNFHQKSLVHFHRVRRVNHPPPFFLLRRMLQEPFRLTIWYLRGGPVLLFPRHYTIALVVEDQKFSRAANEHFRLTIRYVKREKHQQKKKTKDLEHFEPLERFDMTTVQLAKIRISCGPVSSLFLCRYAIAVRGGSKVLFV